MSRHRPAARDWTRHIEPCGCNPYQGIMCVPHREEAALRASDNCWYCADGEPVAMHEGKPACEKCSATFRESEPSLEVAS